MQLHSKVRAIQDIGWHGPRKGDTGVYVFGADYVPGWDAGRFDVKLDNPRGNQTHCSHWTHNELCENWEVYE